MQTFSASSCRKIAAAPVGHKQTGRQQHLHQRLPSRLLLALALLLASCAPSSSEVQFRNGAHTGVAHEVKVDQRQPKQPLSSLDNVTAAAAQATCAHDRDRDGTRDRDRDQQLAAVLGGPETAGWPAEQHRELPLMTSSRNPNTAAQMEACSEYFYRQDELHGRISVSALGITALVAKMQSAVYDSAYAHYYDTYQDLKRASGPQVDQEQCLAQLENLGARARHFQRDKYQSRDLNFYQLMDTFGHLGSGILVGNAFWEGMYHECLRLQIELDEPAVGPGGGGGGGNGSNGGRQHGRRRRAPTRYCVASLKLNDWKRVDRYDVLNVKAGVCLPRACDSSNYRNKYDLIMQLIEFQMRRAELGQAKLAGLYCLPDEDSAARSLGQAPGLVKLVLAGLLGWLALLAYCTYKHEKLAADGVQNTAHSKLYRLLSVKNNLSLLFDTTRGSSLMEVAGSAGDTRPAGATKSQLHEKATGDCNNNNRQEASAKLQEQQQRAGPPPPPQAKVIDLRCIEGIKVLAMVYVITGHVLMCLSNLAINGREMTANDSLAFFLANLVPAFAVNAFFTITGLLTCYLMFKQQQQASSSSSGSGGKSGPSASSSMLTSPIKWLAFIVYRYLRIMPMYALVVLYTKTLAKYAGSGPLWDYGTSSLSQRRSCERESWLWTLAFAANFKSPLEHCIPSAWYLANDFQFFMVTPLFLALLQRRPALGKRALWLAALAGYLAGLWSILGSEVDDLRPIAKFAPNGFKTYVSHFSDNYTWPFYRIPAYLIGLLIGFRLHEFEQRQLRYLAAQKEANLRENHETTSNNNNKAAAAEDQPPRGQQMDLVGGGPADWPPALKRWCLPVAVFLVAGVCVTPVIGSRLHFSKLGAKLLVALVANTYHLCYTLAVGLFIMLATTGHANRALTRLLAAPQWKPLARLSLCVVLVNVEVISYLMQTNSNLHYLSNQYHTAMNLLCVAATYLVSVVVCVLFEAPIRGGLNSLVTMSISRLAAKSKTD